MGSWRSGSARALQARGRGFKRLAPFFFKKKESGGVAAGKKKYF